MIDAALIIKQKKVHILKEMGTLAGILAERGPWENKQEGKERKSELTPSLDALTTKC